MLARIRLLASISKDQFDCIQSSRQFDPSVQDMTWSLRKVRIAASWSKDSEHMSSQHRACSDFLFFLAIYVKVSGSIELTRYLVTRRRLILDKKHQLTVSYA